MNRDLLAKLQDWNRNERRKPLVLMGARQVGKTWLMEEFSRICYPEDTVKVNFMTDDVLRAAMEHVNLDAQSVVEVIETVTSQKIVAGRTLLLMDEIQEAPRALTALKFFQEQMPQLAIIVAGSLLGVAVNRNRKKGTREKPARVSFPVGKVNFLDVRPMTFVEFLDAIGETGKSSAIREEKWSVMDAMSPSFEDLVRKYALVGGMPEAVLTYSSTRNLADVRKVQQEILQAYDEDFAKHIEGAMLQKVRLLWRSVPAQLAKENKKFIYTALREGARAREYEVALEWLEDAGMVCRVNRVTRPDLPLKVYEEFGAFKLYAHDVGLVSAMSELPPSVVLEGNKAFTHAKGMLAEQLVLEELVARDVQPYYWSPDDTRAEVEFVVQGERAVFPIEVKAEKNLKAKSLKIYRERFSPERCLLFSMDKRSPGTRVDGYPLYAIAAVRL